MSKPRVSQKRLIDMRQFRLSDETFHELVEDLIDARRDLAASEQRCRELEADLRFTSTEVERLTLELVAQPPAAEPQTYTVGSIAAIASQRQKEGK